MPHIGPRIFGGRFLDRQLGELNGDATDPDPELAMTPIARQPGQQQIGLFRSGAGAATLFGNSDPREVVSGGYLSARMCMRPTRPGPDDAELCIGCGAEIVFDADLHFECHACREKDRRRSIRRVTLSGTLIAASCAATVAFAVKSHPPIYSGYGVAVHELSRQAAMERDNVEVRYQLAAELEHWDALEEAEHTYSEILDTDPYEYVAWVRRAIVRYHRGNPNGAIADLERALEVSRAPTAEALAYLGFAYSRIENWSAAMEALTASIALDPDIARVRLELSHVFEELEDYAMAAQQLATGLELSPDVSDARELRERLRLLRLRAGVPESDIAGVDPLWVPLERHANVMIAEVRFNDAVSAPLVLDTGASFTTVNRAIANELGLQFELPVRLVNAATANGTVILPIYRIDHGDCD